MSENTTDYTISGFQAALGYFTAYLQHGAMEPFALMAEHDVIYIDVSIETLTPDSEDGMKLIALGWHPDKASGNWAYNT